MAGISHGTTDQAAMDSSTKFIFMFIYHIFDAHMDRKYGLKGNLWKN